MMLEQTTQAAADSAAIAKCVTACYATYRGYSYTTYKVNLISIPEGEDWTPDRVGRALIDYCDSGWSPFGGTHHLISITTLEWAVTVYID